ncbi:MAG: methyltransferase domain-containing protein [Candidatus Dadabacteria bacterium]|nr:methyltransferase domain-containing protein [Candidatus Dadabacteria bacterium]
MSEYDPIDLLFGGMGQLGPGGDAYTLEVLRGLPERRYETVVDAGSGTGRQTIALARELGTVVHAVDSHGPFLDELKRRASEAGVARLVETHLMDMADIPHAFSEIDLLWSEGAAYSIGFENALRVWAPAVGAGGFVVASELTLLAEDAPERAAEFLARVYPAIQSVERNLAAGEGAGLRAVSTYTLPREAWTRGYYDALGPRAESLKNHPDASVREMAEETLNEIEVFESSGGSYGYVFYVFERAA